MTEITAVAKPKKCTVQLTLTTIRFAQIWSFTRIYWIYSFPTKNTSLAPTLIYMFLDSQIVSDSQNYCGWIWEIICIVSKGIF